MDGERRIVKKCRVLVRKLKLGEIREREEKHSEHILNQNNGANGSNRSPHTRVESENMRKRESDPKRCQAPHWPPDLASETRSLEEVVKILKLDFVRMLGIVSKGQRRAVWTC